MTEQFYLEKIQKDIEYSVNCQEEILRAVQRVAELLEILMVEDELITDTQYAQLANSKRLQK